MSIHAYDYPAMSIVTVMKDVDEYIIPENQKAVRYLWSKNILTVQTNNYDNNESWINIGDLSTENARIFWDLANDERMNNPNNILLGYVGNGKGFRVSIVPGKGNDTFEAFKPLIDFLGMQDIQKDGYMTVDEFLMEYTDCWEIIRNPDYRPVLSPRKLVIKDPLEFSKAYDKYVESIACLKYIKKVDYSKMTKTLQEYLEEFGFLSLYDEDEGKIFYNATLYNGHMNYKKGRKLDLK